MPQLAALAVLALEGVMRKRKANEYFHVYVLVSAKNEDLIKVGKANNLLRAHHLARMGYAGRTDWMHVATFPLDSNHNALALESLINAKLSNQGYKVPRMSWVNLINKRESYADECFSCTKEHAIAVANQMADVIHCHVATVS